MYYPTDTNITTDLFVVNDDHKIHIYSWMELCNNVLAPIIYDKIGMSNADNYISQNNHLIDSNIIDHLYDLFLIAKHC